MRRRVLKHVSIDENCRAGEKFTVAGAGAGGGFCGGGLCGGGAVKVSINSLKLCYVS